MEERGIVVTKKNTTSNLATTIGDRELIMERLFDAPRELVFQVWTSPEHVARWWPPFGFTIPVCTIDLRPGGLWHYCMRSPEGQEHWVRSMYREIVVPEWIVYTSVFADKDANPVEGLPEQLATTTFGEYEGKTRLTTRIQFTSEADLQAVLSMNMVQGLSVTWNNLIDYLQAIQGKRSNQL
jgi:uncharacterized protein YndB with AHSA1/START domain